MGQSKLKRRLLVVTTIVLTLVAAVFIAFKVSPYPSVWVIRSAFNKGGIETNQKLEKYVPKGIASQLNIVYDPTDKTAKLDLYYPDSVNQATTKLPTIVWTHGGGLVSGSKEQVANYCKILASYGFTVAAIDYSVAPEAHYPTPVRQLNAALHFLSRNASKYLVDRQQFILAGDSGGAHISAQLAAIVTSPSYAQKTKVEPKIKASQIRGLLLYCGPYETAKVDTEGKFGGFMETVLWAYSGDKNFVNNEYFKTASVLHYVTSDFPPTFISAGNADPLESHSLALADKLDSLDVAVERFFFLKNHKPQLPHEYQFNLENDAAALALSKSVDFVKSKVSP